MHRIVLSLVALWMAFAPMCMAQVERTKPEPSRFEPYVMSQADTVCFYLYNADAGIFWPNRSNFGTILERCPAPALPIFFVRHQPRDGRAWDGAVRIMVQSSYSATRWEELTFFDSDGSYLVSDHGDLTYRLTPSERNTAINGSFYPNCGLGIKTWEGMEVQQYRFGLLDTLDVPDGYRMCMDWKLVAPSEYAAIQSDLCLYYAAMALHQMIDSVKVHYPHINLAQQQAVYDDVNSTLDMMEDTKRLTDQAIALSQLIDQSQTDYSHVDTQAAISLLASNHYTDSDLRFATYDLQVAQRREEVARVFDGKSYPVNAGPLWDEVDTHTNHNGWLADTGSASVLFYSGTLGVLDARLADHYTLTSFVGDTSEAYPFATRTIKDGRIWCRLAYLPRGHYRWTVQTSYVKSDATAVDNVGVYLFANCGQYDQTISAIGQDAVNRFDFDFYSTGCDTLCLGIKIENSNVATIYFNETSLWYYGDIDGTPSDIEQQYILTNYQNRYPSRETIIADAAKIDAYFDAIDLMMSDFPAAYSQMQTAARELDYSIYCHRLLMKEQERCETLANTYSETNATLSEQLGDIAMQLDAALYADDMDMALTEELGIDIWALAAYIDGIVANATGINTITPDSTNGFRGESKRRPTIYNILGQPLRSIQQGLNIVDGKKVLNR